jgi:hypothetical protein
MANYSRLFMYKMTVAHPVLPDLMLLFQEFLDATREEWFPAEEYNHNDNSNDDNSDNDNDESDAKSVNGAATLLTPGNPCLSDYVKESLMKQESLDRVAAVEAWQRDCDARKSPQLPEQAKGKRKAESQLQPEMSKRKGGSGVGNLRSW